MKPQHQIGSVIRSMVRSAALVTLVTSSIGIATLQSKPAMAAKPVLTQKEAQLRYEQVSDPKYNVSLDLTSAVHRGEKENSKIHPQYSGSVSIQFNVSAKAQGVSEYLFLDFCGENDSEVEALTVNRRPLEVRWDMNKTRILIPSTELILGARNIVELKFKTRFTSKGKGFHRAVDSEDKQVYVYTNLEPFFANEVFPLFDQPDLKGVFEFTVKTPSHWLASGNTLEEKESLRDGDFRTWYFKPTPKMSSYLIGISAGPFQEIYPQKRTDRVPMRILAPQSLARFVESETWFEITRKTLASYEEKFGAYPYDKYDQIITPGTASQAMESLAAITFNPNHVSRGKLTVAERSRLANHITHEMAHQWFGNLVTMKWWDDLWLNEAFATFMASVVLDPLSNELSLYPVWSSFFSGEKVSASRADSYSTTHPVAVDVPDTATGFSNFDALVYDKGASVLKQLFYLMGKEKFFEGLRKYFDEYQWGNATQQDFLRILSQSSGMDLKKWGEDWIFSSGINTLEAKFKYLDSGELVLTVLQTPDPFSQKLRTHRLKVRFYQRPFSWGKFTNEDREIEVSGPVTELRFKNLSWVKFILLNVEDHAYVRVKIDRAMQKFLMTQFDSLASGTNPEEVLTQQQAAKLVFDSLKMIDQTEAGDLSTPLRPKFFVDWAISHLHKVTDPALSADLLGYIRSAFGFIDEKELLITHKNEFEKRISKIHKFLFDQKPGSEMQSSVFKSFLSLPIPVKLQPKVLSWLGGPRNNQETNQETNHETLGIEMHQGRRWMVVVALARSGFPDIKPLIENELARDQSEQGKASAQAAEAAVNSPHNKKYWYEALSEPKRYTLPETLEIGDAFKPVMFSDSTGFVTSDFIDRILAMTGDLDRKTGAFIRRAYPLGYSEDFDRKVREFAVAEAGKKISPLISRALIEMSEDSRDLMEINRLLTKK